MEHMRENLNQSNMVDFFQDKTDNNLFVLYKSANITETIKVENNSTSKNSENPT